MIDEKLKELEERIKILEDTQRHALKAIEHLMKSLEAVTYPSRGISLKPLSPEDGGV